MTSVTLRVTLAIIKTLHNDNEREKEKIVIVQNTK